MNPELFPRITPTALILLFPGSLTPQACEAPASLQPLCRLPHISLDHRYPDSPLSTPLRLWRKRLSALLQNSPCKFQVLLPSLRLRPEYRMPREARWGRVIGKMGHSERQGENRFKNVYGEMDQKLFEAGVDYFKGGK